MTESDIKKRKGILFYRRYKIILKSIVEVIRQNLLFGKFETAFFINGTSCLKKVFLNETGRGGHQLYIYSVEKKEFSDYGYYGKYRNRLDEEIYQFIENEKNREFLCIYLNNFFKKFHIEVIYSITKEKPYWLIKLNKNNEKLLNLIGGGYREAPRIEF